MFSDIFLVLTNFFFVEIAVRAFCFYDSLNFIFSWKKKTKLFLIRTWIINFDGLRISWPVDRIMCTYDFFDANGFAFIFSTLCVRPVPLTADSRAVDLHQLVECVFLSFFELCNMRALVWIIDSVLSFTFYAVNGVDHGRKIRSFTIDWEFPRHCECTF